ncbi:hypothetical protein Tco_1129292 [Tanacetum coccineum]
MYHQKYVDYVELLWDDFIYQINNKVYKKQEKMYYPHFTKVIIHHFLIQEKSLSWRNRIGMHTSKDDYLINTLRFVSRREASQIYKAVPLECLTSPEMKESKAYKTYLGYAAGEVPPKVAIKFKKASPSKKESELVLGDEEPVKNGKRFKTPAKKYASKPAIGIVIREPPVETKSKRKEKENVDVAHGKGIELLSEVALVMMKTTTTTNKNQVMKAISKRMKVEQKSDTEQDEESDDDDQEEEECKIRKPTEIATGIVQGKGNDTEMTEAQQGNNNFETTQEQVVKDAHVTVSTVPNKTEVPVTSSSRSSDLASKFLKFSDTPQTDAEIVSLQEVHVHHEVTRTQAPTLLTISVLVIPKSSSVFTNIPQSSYTFTPAPIHATSTPPPTIKTTNPLSNLPDFSLEVSNFAPPVIEKLIKELHDEVTLAKVSYQPQYTYEAAFTLTEFELKKILLDKMETSESYLTAPEHQDCYDGLKKSYALDKDLFYSYDVKEEKDSKDVEPTTGPKKKDSTPGSSKGINSQPKYTGKSVHSEEPVFEVSDSDMPHDQAGNLGDNEEEPIDETASRCDWFKKPTPHQEPNNPDWNVGKTTKEGPTQTWLMNLAASNPTDKSLKDFDEFMSTPIGFSGYILNGLKIKNLTQEILLGPTFRLLKGTHSNYAELEYDFEEYYKALLEKLDLENSEGGDYPFDLSKPLPLITYGKHQRVPFKFFINNDLKYLQGGILTMTYRTSTTKIKAAKYDLPGIEDMKILLDKMEKSESYLTAPKHRDCYDGLKKSYALDKDFFYSYDVYSLKRGRKDKDKDEDPSAGFTPEGTKSQPKSSSKSVQSEEPVFEVADSDLPQDQEGNLGDNEDEPRDETASRRDWFKKPTPPQEPTDPDWNVGKTTKEGPTQNWLMTLAASTSTDKSLKDFDELMSTPIDFSSLKLEYDFEECYKALSEKLDWENPKGGDYPFDLSKPLPLITHGKRQRVPFEFFINNDLKYLQGGISTMTYTTSTTKTKAAKYDLPGIEDMVPNIWSPVKVAYDKYALWGISHWREQRKSFYAFARGMQSRGDVYSTKRILAVTHVSVMRKHGYGYLEEIVVRRADNALYRFKEGDFPRLRINDIEDMLILVVQNWLTNLSGDDVADFAIALRMFTRSLVIQKRVEDLQLGVESYQKKINITKPDTTRPNLKKQGTHTLHIKTLKD